jgi:hypothetical protein
MKDLTGIRMPYEMIPRLIADSLTSNQVSAVSPREFFDKEHDSCRGEQNKRKENQEGQQRKIEGSEKRYHYLAGDVDEDTVNKKDSETVFTQRLQKRHPLFPEFVQHEHSGKTNHDGFYHVNVKHQQSAPDNIFKCYFGWHGYPTYRLGNRNPYIANNKTR